MKLTIGNVELKNNVILAPMAGVTDLPFRVLCKEQGAGLLCMEMPFMESMLCSRIPYSSDVRGSFVVARKVAFIFPFSYTP